MTVRSVLLGLLVVGVGVGCAAGAYWGLLSVPESNVLALLLSTLLALLIAFLVACTTASVLAIAGGTPLTSAVRWAPTGVPGFLLGLMILVALWWVTSFVDTMWALHSGEIDAMVLHYAGTANTAWMHTAVAWVMWFVRWGLGLSAVIGGTAGTVHTMNHPPGAISGLGLALSPVPLGATIVALLAGRALWNLAYWRPAGLGADSTELMFVSLKLGALFLSCAIIAVLVLHLFARRSGTSRTA